MKMDLRISIKHYHHASVWRELVTFRAGEMQPGAGDTGSRQTEAGATAFPQRRAGRAGGK